MMGQMPEILNMIEVDGEQEDDSEFKKAQKSIAASRIRSAFVEKQRSTPLDLGIRSQKVEAYCNLASELEAPIDKILDELAMIRYRATAYVNQVPNSGDYTVMSLALPLIAKLGTMIKWENLSNKWHRNDFERETQMVMELVRKIEVVLICTTRVIFGIRDKTRDLLEDIIPPAKKMERDLRMELIQHQPGDEAQYWNKNGIRVTWNRDPKTESIELKWPGEEISENEREFHSANLMESSQAFRIRILRYLISYAKRTLLNTLSSLRNVETLIDVELSRHKEMMTISTAIENETLSANDVAFLRKAKRDFDQQITTISDTLMNFKYTFFELYRYKKLYKRMRTSIVHVFPPMFPILHQASLWIDDLEIVRIMRPLSAENAIQRSTLPEEEENAINAERIADLNHNIIHYLLKTDSNEIGRLDMLVSLVNLTLQRVNLTKQAQDKFKKLLRKVCLTAAHTKSTVRKTEAIYLNSSVFKFFRKSQGKTLNPSKIHLDLFSPYSKIDASGEEFFANHPWISIPGSFEIGFVQEFGFVIRNPQDETRDFESLQESEKRVLLEKMLRALNTMIATEQVYAKDMLERFQQVKTILKTLDENQRNSDIIQSAIYNFVIYVQLMARLLKAAKSLSY